MHVYRVFFFSRFFFSAPQIPEPESLVFIFFGVPAKGFAPVGLVSRRVGRAPLLKTVGMGGRATLLKTVGMGGRAPLLKTVGMGAPPVQCTGRTFPSMGCKPTNSFTPPMGCKAIGGS